MQVFVQVMESGNFTRAAKVLNIPRSTVSTVIQTLEDRLGTQLFLRSTRQMAPTEDGERFLGMAREIVDAVDDTDRMFRRDNTRLRGRLRIDVPNRIGRRIIIPALPALIADYPDLKIELSTSDSMVDLIAEGLDCIIRVGSPSDSEIICRKLGDLQMMTCASTGYFERHGMPTTADQLKNHVMVNYGPSLPTRPASFVHKSLNQIFEVPVSNSLTVNNAEAYIAAARAGLGLIQIPAFDVKELVEAGELIPVLEDFRPPSMQLSLLYARRRNIPARVAMFQDWIAEVLRVAGVFDQ